MKLGFSEFSYGYAFTENLIRWSSSAPNKAPIFPNLVQEGTSGYDVQIDFPGLPLFFQFKLPTLLIRNNAREISQFGLPGISIPFFRIPLMRRDTSDQHKHLIKLERQFPASVFYASPALTSETEFHDAYKAAEVHFRSALFSPISIGHLPDDDPHSVSYKIGSSIAWLCSRPNQVEAENFDNLVLGWGRRLKRMRRKEGALRQSIEDIRSDLLTLISPELFDFEVEIQNRIEARRIQTGGGRSKNNERQLLSDKLLTLRELSRISLGVDFLLAQPPKQP